MKNKRDGVKWPQKCRAANVLKRTDIANGVTILRLGVEVAVSMDFYQKHRHDPTLLVVVVGVEAENPKGGNP